MKSIGLRTATRSLIVALGRRAHGNINWIVGKLFAPFRPGYAHCYVFLLGRMCLEYNGN